MRAASDPRFRGETDAAALEVDELAYRDVKRPSDANKDIQTDIGRSGLDLPEVGAAGSRHEGKLALRDAALRTGCLDLGAEGSLFAHVVHSASIRAVSL